MGTGQFNLDQRTIPRCAVNLLHPLFLATLNLKGVNGVGKKDLVDLWGDKYGVSVIAIQEPKINVNSSIATSNYVWFFSTGVKAQAREKVEKLKAANKPVDSFTKLAAQEFWGVGFMVHKTVIASVENVISISARIAVMFLKGRVKIAIVSAYAPQSESDDALKDEFYKQLAEVWTSLEEEWMRVLCGDFNAKLAKIDEHLGSNFGNYYLKATDEQFNNMGNNTWDNRRRFIEFVMEHNLWVSNTHYNKTSRKICTFKPPGTNALEAPWTYRNFAQYDFILFPDRWKNTCRDAESDTLAETLSDHYPVWCKMLTKFKTPPNKTKKSNQYDLKPNATQIIDFNTYVGKALESADLTSEGCHSKLDDALLSAAKDCLPVKDTRIKKPWITSSTFAMIQHKHALFQKGISSEFKQYSKLVAREAKKDWEKWLAEITEKDLDIRDKWLGIKYLKNTRGHKLYERADVRGRVVPFRQHAEAAAEYLETKQWGNVDCRNSPQDNRDKKQNRRSNVFNTQAFNLRELKHLLGRMKRNKASGPDELPTEFFTWLDDTNLNRVLRLINFWWENGSFPEDKLRAYIASIYKKGDPKLQENYRPISLLCSIYKIYAALIQTRLAEAVDGDLQQTQYGFRKSRSTVIPLACVRRILERAEASQDPCFLVFLDWEKAFDRISQSKLIESLVRMDIPDQYIAAIKSLYNNPNFAVRVGTEQSEWRTQRRGIRQGCPLSPYLFLILMTVMFRDVHDELNMTRGTLDPLNFTELLYADDTILITNNLNAMNRLLAKVEEHATYYGLSFNKTKCVCLPFNSTGAPRFQDGSKVKVESGAVYLGSNISRDHNLQMEVSNKISSCFVVLNRLNFFWRKSNCPVNFKLSVFDAVIRAKLVYGLDVVHLSKHLMQKLNTFQLKGLRKILNMQTTYINRQNTNAKVFENANAARNPSNLPGRNIKSFSCYVEEKQESLLKHIVRSDQLDPLRVATLRHNSPIPCLVSNRRPGRPRLTWAYGAYENIWVKHGYGTKQDFKADPDKSILKMEVDIHARTI